ncbi:MAG: substrate-binding domain-containing protein [Terriglobales bacterium]
MTGKILISLTTRDNDYQRAQAVSVEAVAKRMAASIEIVYADNDPVNQSQQILAAIQRKNSDITAVITEPVGTGMVQVAEAAAKAGIAWAVLNREVDYAARLQQMCKVPVFEVGVDQEAVGHIHAAQLAKLVPGGGTVLYIEGPAAGSAAKLRTQGTMAKKPANVELKILKGNWTEESGHKTVGSWLKLSTSKSHGFVAVVAQDDAMAIGARKAFSALTDANERSAWLSLPHIGCDGLPETGQQYVRRGQLTATVVYPLVAGIALEMYLNAKSSGTPIPERTFAAPTSYPELGALKPLTMAFAK